VEDEITKVELLGSYSVEMVRGGAVYFRIRRKLRKNIELKVNAVETS